MERQAQKEEQDIFMGDVKPATVPIDEQKKGILYPDGQFRSTWDLLMTL